MFNCGPVFQANYNSEADIVINQGGTDSGKTYAIVQLLFTLASTTIPPAIDPVITVVSESVPNLKKGAYRIAKAIYNSNPTLQSYIKGSPNETDRIFHFKNGWIIEFIGVTDEQNAKQGKRQYLFVNEAQGIPYLVFWQLAKRTRVRTFIDYNPTAPFWSHDKLIGTTKESNDLNATVQLIISDHRHNPFLTEKEHEKTENIKDPDLWLVYARGKTGNLTGLIYKTWKLIPDSDFPWKEDGKFGALDFGYTNDPTAGVRMARVGEKIFIHEICYSPAISATKLKQIYMENTFTADDPVYCEHDPDMIRQLRTSSEMELKHKIDFTLLAIAARKGLGSIKAGIAKVNEYDVFVTASSKNVEEERKKYMWLIDPDTGKPTNTPIDKDNHLMDAIRYGIYSHFYRSA